MNKEQRAEDMESSTVQYDPRVVVKARCQERLGEADGDVFYFLWERFMELQTVWGELQVILNSSEQETALLKKHIPVLCRVATDSMWREIITTIVAYGDGCIQQKSKYAGLPDLLRTIRDEYPTECDEALNDFKNKVIPLVQMRHKHLAHFSRKAIELRSTDKLEQANVSTGMDAIKSVLTTYSRLRKFPYPQWECGAAEEGGAKSLLVILKKH